MLIANLVLAAIVLAVTNRSVYASNRIGLVPVLICIGCCCMPILVTFVPLATWELTAVLGIAAIVLTVTKRMKLFHVVSIMCAVVVFGGNCFYAWHVVSELKRDYPFESIAERLPVRPASISNISDELSKRLDESELFMQPGLRASALRSLHESTLRAFAEQPNFGAARMSGIPTRTWIEHLQRGASTIRQPGLRDLSAQLWQEIGQQVSMDAELRSDFSQLNDYGIRSFVNSEGSGYVHDRQHVAGFTPHGFRDLPTSPSQWSLQTLDLVGLVVHSKPVVYVSENLPRMDELRQA